MGARYIKPFFQLTEEIAPQGSFSSTIKAKDSLFYFRQAEIRLNFIISHDTRHNAPAYRTCIANYIA